MTNLALSLFIDFGETIIKIRTIYIYIMQVTSNNGDSEISIGKQKQILMYFVIPRGVKREERQLEYVGQKSNSHAR